MSRRELFGMIRGAAAWSLVGRAQHHRKIAPKMGKDFQRTGQGLRFSMQENRPGWIASIDGLRAIAVLSVLIHHVNNGRGFPNIALGNVGVMIFFCISGFLAYYVL